MAKLIFSVPGYTTRLLWRLLNVWISFKSKMASVNRKLICVIFDSLQIHMPPFNTNVREITFNTRGLMKFEKKNFNLSVDKPTPIQSEKLDGTS